MTPQTIALIVALIAEVVKDAPGVAAALSKILTKEARTPADWEALRLAILSEDYSSLVPQSQIPPGQ